MMRVKNPEVFAEVLAASSIGHNELARKLNRSRGHLHDIKAGRKRVRREDAKVIARSLGVAMNDLFENDPIPDRVKVSATTTQDIASGLLPPRVRA